MFIRTQMLCQSESLFLQKLVLNFLAWDLISQLFTGVIFATFGKEDEGVKHLWVGKLWQDQGKHEAYPAECEEETKLYLLGRGDWEER